MESSRQSRSIKSRTATGASVLIASRLITRCIDFGALVILARLLSPDDFGLVAIAMSIIMIVEAIMELPLGFALVSLPTRTKAHYDTVFTMQLLRGLILAVLLLISSWPFSEIYGDPRLIWLICALSVAPASRGLNSPRIIEFSIDFNFFPNLVMEVSGKIVALALSVGSAWLTGSYWSLAIGTIASPVTMGVVSYFYAPYRPALTLRKWHDFSVYVRWTTFGQTISALVWQMDMLMLGRFVSRFELGAYSMAIGLAGLPAQIFVVQLMNPLMVAFTSVREDPQRLAAAYLKSAASIVALGIPIMVGMGLNAELILRLAFGQKWLGAVDILRGLSWAIIPTFFTSPLSPLAVTLGKSRVITRLLIIELVIKFPVMMAGILLNGIAGAVTARLLIALVIAACALVTVRGLIGLSIRDQLLAAWRPVLSAAVMAIVISPLQSTYAEGTTNLELALHLATIVGAGAAVYAASTFLMWGLSKRPDGLEAHLVRLSISLMRKIRTFRLAP